MTYEILEGGNNKIKFNLIVLYHTATDTLSDFFNDDNLRHRPYSIDVSDYDKVEINFC